MAAAWPEGLWLAETWKQASRRQLLLFDVAPVAGKGTGRVASMRSSPAMAKRVLGFPAMVKIEGRSQTRTAVGRDKGRALALEGSLVASRRLGGKGARSGTGEDEAESGTVLGEGLGAVLLQVMDAEAMGWTL